MGIEAHKSKYNKAIGEALEKEYFEGWFNIQKDDKTAISSGAWDFRIHILTDTVCGHLKSHKTALEIGHGGGRLIRHAASYFDFVYGVDIHDYNDEVRKRVNATNIELDKPIEDISNIDFVYSFITFLHLQSIDEFYRYINEIKRALNPGGLAQIYYQEYDGEGYRLNTEAEANNLSLQIGRGLVIESCEGLEIIEFGNSWKGIEGYTSRKGHQTYVTLKK